MTTINTYLYPNSVVAEIWDTTIFTTRNRAVYARPVTVYQGINNPIQVVAKNQDQKPVNLTGYTMTAEIQDPVSQATVQSLSVTWSNISLGRGNFTIGTELVNALDQRLYKLTFKTTYTSTNVDTPVYIDDNFGVPLDLVVKAAYYNEGPILANLEPTGITIDGGTI